jgi:hypothetical protein
MSIREWFEDMRKITGLLKNSVERDSKDVNVSRGALDVRSIKMFQEKQWNKTEN